MLQTLELFGGIGAPRKALVNLGIQLKCIDYVENLKYAVTAYNQMYEHQHHEQDVRTWNLHVDLLIHGSPCQDFSNNGKNDLSTGRSILYERTLEIIKKELFPRPKVVVWENVTGLISKRNIEHFNAYLSDMESMGYSNSFKVLNALDYGMPQHRERVFVVSILGNHHFTFPEPIPLEKHVMDFIDRDVNDPSLELKEKEKSLFFEVDGQLYIQTNNNRHFQEVYDGDIINVERPTSKTRRGRVGSGVCKTITTSNNQVIYYDGRLRRLTTLENWRLMGFSDADYYAVLQKNIPDKDMQRLAGNSIVVPVLEQLFKAIFEQVPHLKEQTQIPALQIAN